MSKKQNKGSVSGHKKSSTGNQNAKVHNIGDGKIEKRAAELTPRPTTPPKSGDKKSK